MVAVLAVAGLIFGALMALIAVASGLWNVWEEIYIAFFRDKIKAKKRAQRLN